MPYIYGIDWSYIVYVLPALLFAMWAQGKVKSTFEKYSHVPSEQTLSGMEAARKILDKNGLYNVRIEEVSGSMTDHYDPRANVVRLSQTVFGARTTAAVGVAAHEVGHVLQYAQEYAPIRFRAAIIPISQIGSTLSWPLIVLGILLSFRPLAVIGVVLFSFCVLFQLFTLPVEFDASRRALVELQGLGMTQEGVDGAKKVLTAAAMTYVAALATSIGNLLRLLSIVKRDD